MNWSAARFAKNSIWCALIAVKFIEYLEMNKNVNTKLIDLLRITP